MTEQERHAMLDTMVQAFATGRAAAGEELLERALERGIPWDDATAAAARGIALRFAARTSLESEGGQEPRRD